MGNISDLQLRIVYGDVTVGVHGDNFDYIFSYAQGGMESLVKEGMEWLYRPPKPTFWRALTDNDRGSGFHLRSGCWLAADTFIRCEDIEVITDGISQGRPCAPWNNRYKRDIFAKEITLIFTYETIITPKTKVRVSYTVYETGRIEVKVHYFGRKGLPQLPVFGMRFIMPTLADRYEYHGLSGETYPDRKNGAVEGAFKIEDLSLTPYVVPQDCGLHTDSSQVKIIRSTSLVYARKRPEEKELIIEKVGNAFAFSCLPYTALEIENATHHEELPPPRRTVLSVYGAVRGIGGIDSWGSDVEEKYHIDAEKDIVFSFTIR